MSMSRRVFLQAAFAASSLAPTLGLPLPATVSLTSAVSPTTPQGEFDDWPWICEQGYNNCRANGGSWVWCSGLWYACMAECVLTVV